MTVDRSRIEKEDMPVTQSAKKTVLVVDDEEGVRIFLKTALENAGFRV